jgi:2-iminobutanoate/2-iminopropanoate deaminase
MFERKPVSAPTHLNEAFDYDRPVPFSRAMTVDFGPAVLVIVSGTASVNEEGLTVHKGDLEAQTRRTFDNLTAVLGAGGAVWKDVVRTTIYLRDMNDYTEFNGYRMEIMRSFGLPFFPPSTCIQARLCRDDLLVEIECWALVEKARAR